MVRHLRDITPVDKLKTFRCCGDWCFRPHEKPLLHQLRYSYISLPNRSAKRQFILDRLSENEKPQYPAKYNQSLCGRTLCDAAYAELYGVPLRTFNTWKRGHTMGRRNDVHGNCLLGGKRLADIENRTATVTAYAREYIRTNCEAMPHNSQFHLPSCTRFTDVYHDFMCFVGEKLEECKMTEVAFISILKKVVPNLKQPKEQRFTKCDTCCSYLDQIRKTPRYDEASLIRLNMERSLHMKRQRNQRRSFANFIVLSTHYPASYMCMITDGMDQAKTFLPQPRLKYKYLSTAYRLKVHVMGCMSFGRSVTCYYDIGEYPHDTNLNANVILNTLFEHQKALPPHIHIQLDNTSRENKSNYFFRCLAALVQTKRVREITIGFLFVGHTHNQLDQLFSRLSTYIGQDKMGILDFPDLERAIQECWKTKKNVSEEINLIDGIEKAYMVPVARRFTQMFAYREWILGSATKQHFMLKDIQFYRIKCNDNGIACLYAKTGAEEECLESKGYELLLNDLPRKCPELIRPCYTNEVNLTALQKTIDDCFALSAIPAKNKANWDKWIAEEKKVDIEWASRLGIRRNKYPRKLNKKTGKFTKDLMCEDNIHKFTLMYYNNEEPSPLEKIPFLNPETATVTEIGEFDPKDDFYKAPLLLKSERDAQKRTEDVWEDILSEPNRSGQYAAFYPDVNHQDYLNSVKIGKPFAWIALILTPFEEVVLDDGTVDHQINIHWCTGILAERIIPLVDKNTPIVTKGKGRRKKTTTYPPLLDTALATQIMVAPVNLTTDKHITALSSQLISEQTAKYLNEDTEGQDEEIDRIVVGERGDLVDDNDDNNDGGENALSSIACSSAITVNIF